VHGQKRPGRMSGYGLQLREKQKAKRIYGILERQFRSYFEKAKAGKGKTGDTMLLMLERRLDNLVYRSGLASSRSQARQLVSHAHFMLNGKGVNIPSLQIESGDVVTVKPTKATEAYWTELLKNKNSSQPIPTWLTVDRAGLKITVNQLPTSELIQSELQMNLIIELYSL
jgi:small subunit ribosomal protein S4